MFFDILGVKGCLQEHEDALEEHERAEGEAVGATGEFAAETAGNFLGSVLPEVDDEGAGREVKDGAEEGEQGVLEEKFITVQQQLKKLL